MTVKTEITALLGEIHDSIGETDSFPMSWSRPGRRHIVQTYPEILNAVGIEPIGNIFAAFENEKSVKCDILALTLQDLLNKLGGRAILIKTLPRGPSIMPGIQPVRFPAVTFNKHFACLDTDSKLVYDPNLLPQPVQLGSLRSFAPYQKLAFENPSFLISTTILQ